jgi:hypothetical protein
MGAVREHGVDPAARARRQPADSPGLARGVVRQPMDDDLAAVGVDPDVQPASATAFLAMSGAGPCARTADLQSRAVAHDVDRALPRAFGHVDADRPSSATLPIRSQARTILRTLTVTMSSGCAE